ncbi:VWA domain-containing protein [Bacillus tianshenii]|uniref:VWA domain-containing protein n=1 Tax=Sutcliffiella tianshenii TaxID=1463404 RepID=UPI001CD3D730|nr:VWA domain-containing protein [Bacillus tianshenii]MCA1321120.1 VWA domain-containing protein [Bacillus tianshenii]
MRLQIEHPLMLIFLIPVIISLYLFWRKKKQKKSKDLVIFTLRSMIYFLIILGLVVPSLLSPVKGIHTVFVLDQSDSVKRMEGEMLDFVNRSIDSKVDQDSYALMTVAENAKLERSFTREKNEVNDVSVNEETNFTNLEEGIKLASSYLPENSKGRIVLLTDGVETNGDILRQAELLSSGNIEFDVKAFQPPNVQDVSIESFTTPQNGFQGEAVPFQVSLESNFDTTATLQITQNKEMIIQEEIAVAKGMNYYSYQAPLKEPGLYSFKAEIIPKDDKIVENNLSHSITTVNGQPKVLLVDQDAQGENVFQALTASGWRVDRIQPELLPTNLAGFLAYESILFHNISGHHLSENQMNLIETAVRDFGVGFVMTGGEESYGLGGYFQTPIERILPVDMDVKGKKEIPSLGLIIVLDRSGSMMGEKFELAKEAAARSVELLREDDTFGFIAFDTQPWSVVETQPIKDKKEVIETIRSTALGGGTDIFPSLSLAYEQLNDLDLKRKHIILLTDGQSQDGAYEELIEEGLQHNVTLSTVAIGADADLNLLEELAGYGTGRFYEVYEASSVPSILSRETALTTKTYIEDNPHVPFVTSGYDWSTRFSAGTPSINSYIATTLKSRADQIISSEKDDPILARMNYGLGRTVAWTSDVSGAWSGSFPTWNEWTGFWNDIVTWSLPSYEKGNYDIQTNVAGGKATVKVEASENKLLPLSISVSNNKGEIIENAKSKLKGPGQYEVEFPALPEIYFLNISQEEQGETVNTYSTGMVVPYSTEFEQKPVNQELITKLTSLNNGKVLEEPNEAFRPWHKNLYQSQSVWIPFVILAFFLLLLEIFIRRFGLSPFFYLKRKVVPKKKPIEKKEKRLPSIKVKETNNSKPKPIILTQEIRKENPVSSEPAKVTKKEDRPSTEKSTTATNNEDRMAQLLKAKNRKRKG